MLDEPQLMTRTLMLLLSFCRLATDQVSYQLAQ
jgi:hypothetical protein